MLLTLFRLTSGLPKIDWGGDNIDPAPAFFFVTQIFNIVTFLESRCALLQ